MEPTKGAVRQLDEIAALPGANTIRVSKDSFSLTDLQTNLVDLLEFQLNPLIRRRLIYALSPADASLNVLYLEDRVLELQRTRETSVTRRTQLQAALQVFAAETAAKGPASVRPGAPDAAVGTIMPQLSDSFLDRLIDIAGQSGAMGYRQDLTDRIIAAGEEALQVDQDIAFYQETLRLLREAMRGVRPAALKPDDVALAFEQIQTRVVETLTLTGEAYELISSANLNPRRSLYSVVGPYSVRNVSSTSVRSLAVGAMLAMLVAFLLMVVVVAVIALIRGETAEASSGGRSLVHRS